MIVEQFASQTVLLDEVVVGPTPRRAVPSAA